MGSCYSESMGPSAGLRRLEPGSPRLIRDMLRLISGTDFQANEIRHLVSAHNLLCLLHFAKDLQYLSPESRAARLLVKMPRQPSDYGRCRLMINSQS